MSSTSVTRPEPIEASAIAEIPATLIDYISDWVEYRAWYHRLPGLQLAIRDATGLRLAAAFGHADRERDEPLTNDHLFRVASQSKMVTAGTILRLHERGLLRLDDTIGTYIPALGSARSPAAAVTLRELMTHGGGLVRDGAHSDFWQLQADYPDRTALLGILGDGGTILPSNSTFKYSNIGYGALGLVIEAVTGASYPDAVLAEVCAPLELRHTRPDWSPDLAGRMATGYSGLFADRDRRPLTHAGTGALAPATGFVSTATDLTTFAAAYFDGAESLLSPASKRLQRQAQWATDPKRGDTSHYGLGLEIRRFGDHDWYGHSGGFPGFNSYTLVEPTAKIAVSVLTSAIDGFAGETMSGVIDLLTAGVTQLGGGATPAGRAAPSRDMFGRYRSLWGVIDLVDLGDRLVLTHPTAAVPSSQFVQLEAVDTYAMKMTRGSGYGSVGEVISGRLTDGRVTGLHGPGGISYDKIASCGE